MIDQYTTIESCDTGFRMTIKGQYGAESVTGWPQLREEMSLQDDAADIVGLTVEEQRENYDEGADFPYGYGPITLKFDTMDAYKSFRNEVRGIEAKRHGGGDHDGAGEVGDFWNRLPNATELRYALDGDADE